MADKYVQEKTVISTFDTSFIAVKFFSFKYSK